MEKEELEVFLKEKLDDYKLEIEIMVNEAIKAIPSSKGLSEVAVSKMINDAINGVSPKIKIDPNPDWNTDKDKPLYGMLDKVKVKPHPGNPYHKEPFITEGHQANFLIRKGMCLPDFELVEKFIKPKQEGKIIGK